MIFIISTCLYSSATENKHESHKTLCENKDFCNVVMPSKDTKINFFLQYQKFGQAPFVIYANLECLIEKFDGCNYNPKS